MGNKDKLRFEWIIPSEVDDNPLNWRVHPESQTRALDSLIYGEDGVGWAGVALVNERLVEDGWGIDSKPTLIDGHDRKTIAVARNEPMPVIIGHWTEEQERKILLTLDPIAALASADKIALENLLQQVSSDEPAVQELLSNMAEAEGLYFDDVVDDNSGEVDFDEFNPVVETDIFYRVFIDGLTRTQAEDLIEEMGVENLQMEQYRFNE